MDLRPKLADDFITAILADIQEHGVTDETVRERWRGLIVDRFVSHSVDFPRGISVQTYQPSAVDQFLAKYPQLEAVIEYLRFALREVWPDVRLVVSVFSDPESCHTCSEGQHLSVEFFSTIADAEEKADRASRAEDDWKRDWHTSPNPFREQKYDQLMYEGGLYSELKSSESRLIRVSRGHGDPDELLAHENGHIVEWEKKRRERAEKAQG